MTLQTSSRTVLPLIQKSSRPDVAHFLPDILSKTSYKPEKRNAESDWIQSMLRRPLDTTQPHQSNQSTRKSRSTYDIRATASMPRFEETLLPTHNIFFAGRPPESKQKTTMNIPKIKEPAEKRKPSIIILETHDTKGRVRRKTKRVRFKEDVW